MFYQKHLPNPPLSNYVESIIYIEGNNKGTGLPKTAMSLVFNLEDSFKLYTNKQFTQFIDYKKYWVAGLQTKPTNVESYGTSKMVVIQFKTLGAFIFLNDPLHYYTDNYIPLDAVFSNLACDTWEQLLEAQTIRDRIAITEKFLQHQLSTRKLPGKKLVSTIALLSDGSHNLTISEICRISGISRKHLNNLSKEYTGVSPKMLASLNRLQSSLKTISSAKAGKLSDVAYELEYFDQAHFNNDFKRFTDLKPTEYVKLTEHIPSLKQVPHFIPFQ